MTKKNTAKLKKKEKTTPTINYVPPQYGSFFVSFLSEKSASLKEPAKR